MVDIPPEVRACLWSYDIDRIDLARDKKRIITNVLNHGTMKATEWLSDTYSSSDIAEAVGEPLPGEWDPKSLNLWSQIYSVRPVDAARALRTSHARL